jgi:S-adenosylmethionine:tRNA ribosyltransferase-isomerase
VGGKRIEEGMLLKTQEGEMEISVERRLEEGRCIVCFQRDDEKLSHSEVVQWLRKFGLMPTPPYIKRMLSDPEEYQTVYGNIEGSVAAPTAGLHFTEELLDRIRKKGVRVLFVVLHVGIGTFAPVKSANIRDHVMEEEEYLVPDEAAEQIREAVGEYQTGGRKRIWAVGTTVMRTLESAFDRKGDLVKPSGTTGLYITPGYEFSIPYKGFITNFHLPRSTPLILVSAFHDREGILDAYEEAKREGYRFYSLGDSMMIRKG